MFTMTTDRLRLLRRVALFGGVGLVVFVAALYFSFPYERAEEMAIRMAADKGTRQRQSVRRARRSDWGLPSATSGCGRGRPPASRPASPSSRLGSRCPRCLYSRPPRTSRSRWRRSAANRLLSAGHARQEEAFRSHGPRPRGQDGRAAGGTRGNQPAAGRHREGRFRDRLGDRPLRRFERRDHLFLRGLRGRGRQVPAAGGGEPLLGRRVDPAALRLGDFGGRVAIEKGIAKLQEIGGKSPDGELALEGDVALRNPVASSTVNAYLRFKLSDSFLKQAANVADNPADGGGGWANARTVFTGMRLFGRLGQLNPPVLSPISPVGRRAPASRPGTRAHHAHERPVQAAAVGPRSAAVVDGRGAGDAASGARSATTPPRASSAGACLAPAGPREPAPRRLARRLRRARGGRSRRACGARLTAPAAASAAARAGRAAAVTARRASRL